MIIDRTVFLHRMFQNLQIFPKQNKIQNAEVLVLLAAMTSSSIEAEQKEDRYLRIKGEDATLAKAEKPVMPVKVMSEYRAIVERLRRAESATGPTAERIERYCNLLRAWEENWISEEEAYILVKNFLTF